jgi:ATP-dependent Lon protease
MSNNIHLEEYSFFQQILEKLVLHVQQNYENELINSADYKKIKEDLACIQESLSTLVLDISLNSFLISLSKIKLLLIESVLYNGLSSIYDTVRLFLVKSYNIPATYIPFLDYFQIYFNTTRVELYNTDKDSSISFKQNVFGKKIKPNTIQLTSSQIDTPSVAKWNAMNKNILLRAFSAKIIIPIEDSLLVLYGHFNNDNLNSFHTHPSFKTKWGQIQRLFNNIDVPETFRTNYMNTVSFRDFIINTPQQVATDCIQAYGELQKIKTKTISQLVKDMSIVDTEKQRQIIQVLLMESDDKDSIFLSNMLYDLVTCDSTNTITRQLNMTFHWLLTKISKEHRQKVLSMNTLTKFNEESMSYDKRIMLMKASENVKKKAMDKLKEINNSNNGESKSKAQQYLDGLLRIPFGIYKKEVIRVKFEELKNKYEKNVVHLINTIKELEEQCSLSDDDLNNTASLLQILSYFESPKINIVTVEKMMRKLKTWTSNVRVSSIDLSKYYDIESITKQLNRTKIQTLRSMINELSVVEDKDGTKRELINTIIKHTYNISDILVLKKFGINMKSRYDLLLDTEQFTIIISTLDQMLHQWQKYQEYQSKYFRELSSRLDNAVHGLPDAKRQIKRLLAQWINGNDQGYVFGFEGPPGTGKTTLAKQGIAKCLKDENGNPRPFVFIALGGSSNGSTLEGHNYTYVGSTWGRIVDGIMESKCMNPIIYIDELDKISKTEHGKELIGILTHMTDPSQNNEFTDKYFSGIKFDISKCLIIFSYNDPELIDKILLDRIQRIRIEALNPMDKLQVAREHIISEIFDNIGMNDDDIILENSELSYIIDTYTLEAGARKLKEKLYEIFREVNLKYLMGDIAQLPFKITKEFVDKVFEKNYKIQIKKIHDTPQVGLANGMYATAAGSGGITQVQCTKIPSNVHLELKLTGSMGDDMKESVNVAKSLALRLLPSEYYKKVVDVSDNEKFGIHVHCPELSTPKSGPSATLVFTIGILSLFMGEPVRNDVAMTGESSLIGKADRIGGVASKLHGSKVAGIKLALLPRKNEEDLKIIRSSNNPVEDEKFKVLLIDDIYDAIKNMMVNGEDIIKKMNKIL